MVFQSLAQFMEHGAGTPGMVGHTCFSVGVPDQPGQHESMFHKTQTKECRAGDLERTL